MRPQRGSRAMSRTGASAWRAPVSSIRRRIVVGHRRHDVRIEGRRRADRLLEARRGPGDEAVQALLVDDRGDAEPRPLDEVALDRVGRLGHLDRAQVGRAGQPRDLADPVGRERAPARARRGRRSPTTSNAQNDPSWATFSARVIRAEQVGDARLDRERRVAVAGRRWSSSLHRPRGEAADELALGDDVEDEGRHHREHREREDPGRVASCTGS